MVVTRDGRNRLRCDLGSRSVECRGLRSGGREMPVLNVQIQLRRHCAGLPAGFADGRMGHETHAALAAFQMSVGLTPDGIYGPSTARALTRAPNGRCRLG
ncbi:MAG: peptidoglycan-binding domain-containing protein [Paracoccaceae bacterium]